MSATSRRRVTLERDACGRPVRISAPGFEEHRIWYHGRLAGWIRRRAGSAPEQVERTRDEAGRIVYERVVRGEEEMVTGYRYDRAGQLVAVTTPGPYSHFEWDGAGRLVAETTAGVSRTFRYDPAGQVTEVTTPHGPTAVEWDGQGRRRRETGRWGRRDYLWNDSGELEAVRTTLADGAVRDHRLTHDPLGRVATVDGAPLVWDSTAPLPQLQRVEDRSAPPVWLPKPVGPDPWTTSADVTDLDGAPRYGFALDADDPRV